MRTSVAFAERLNDATVQKHFHPIEDIDWSVPIDIESEHRYLPEKFISLNGTALYASMSEREKKLLSLYEAVSYFSTGIWLENMLMYGFLYKLYAMDYSDPDTRYMLHEVGEEANHSIMFHEFVRRVGLGYSPARWHNRVLGRIGARQIPTVNMYLFFIGILAGEEPPDHFARAAREDDRVHPLVRRITEIHSIEEARHIAYAREFLAKRYHEANRFQKLHARIAAPISVRVVVGEFFTPRWPTGYDQAPAHL
ncbi:MAG: diiron oxygenase, partial [Deltaproteobacteria bacterium]|nr:diiron oxygenase [Deltaproteobacteria bacterium]